MEKYRVITLITEWSVFLCLTGYLQQTEGCTKQQSGVYRFGTNCQYMCHCKNNTACNISTGVCTNGCASNWYGPACQFVDLAYDQHSRHTSNIPSPDHKTANFANDADVGTCSYTNYASASTSEPMWKVWLPQKRVIKELTILTTDTGKEYFKKFEVNVEDVQEDKKDDASYIPSNSQVCYKQEVRSNDNKEIHVICEQPLVGNQVRIRLNTIKSQLILCDVKINGGRNLAFRKSVTTNEKREEIKYLPENAVDGSTKNSSWDFCFVSADSNKVWFDVDFGAIVTITYIHLIEYNYNRIRNYKLQKSYENVTWQLVHDDNGKNPPTLDIFLNVGTQWIRLHRENDIRTIICELQAFGDCAPGYCGFECSSLCRCKVMEDRLTGICTSGCEGRWTGPNATCVTECATDKWDVDCSKTCGNCLNSKPCDVATGTCTSGCVHGYKQTDLCNTECVDGTYGLDCMYNCSKNCQNGGCVKSSGACINGCLPGFTGNKCDSECEEGSYGMNCQETCSGNCLNNQYCHHINGTCLSGCKPGWKGDRCNQECDAGKWGLHCNDTCGNCLKSSPCRKTDGVCEGGCAAGYKVTDLCVEECDNGTYGLNCSKECNPNCKSPCSNVDGYCSLCTSGWKGRQCDIECLVTEWGESCRQKCGMCAIGRCDIRNGSCSEGCGPGYYDTDMCLDACEDGKHGNDCTEDCGYCQKDTTCDKTTGECRSGCVSGYTGGMCMQALPNVDQPSPTAAIAGGVSGTVVLIVMALVIVLVIIRRRKQSLRSNPSGKTTLSDDVFDSSKEKNNMTCHAEKSELSKQDNIYEIDEQLETSTSGEYYNTSSIIRQNSPLAVKLTELSTHVKQGLANFNFLRQFEDIPYGLQCKFETKAARSPDNIGKNRYKDMYPYDYCRVILKQPNSGPPNDYINASHIKGHHKENAYIASQGPTHKNMNDFWRMIWEKDIHVIAMVTNLVEQTKMKCIKYWAPVDESVQYGDINIFTESENIFADYDVRRFKVCHEGSSESRSIVHFGYTAWPDKGVPSTTSSLLHFWRCVRKIDPSKAHTWLVHCSAGVGRTGTFIALDFLYDQGKDTGHVNVNQCVKDLRDQRVNMVQVKEQYYYLYMIVLDALVLPSQPLTMDEFELRYQKQLEIDTKSGNPRLKLEYQVLSEAITAVPDEIRYEDSDAGKDIYLCANDSKNKDKNRFPDILAPDEYRPFLSTPVKGTSNYINAIYMPSYCDLHAFIITQTPLPTTAVDHCRLIVEQDVQVIVTFDKEIEIGNVGEYLPDAGTIELGPFCVSFVTEEEKSGYIIRKHTLSYNSKEHNLTQIIHKSWEPSNVCPDDPNQMLDFLLTVDNLQGMTENKPLIVQCMNGAERSGLIVALMNILEYVRIDGEVSIPHVIRYLQARRPQIIPNYNPIASSLNFASTTRYVSF